jgi:hypothetical protein
MTGKHRMVVSKECQQDLQPAVAIEWMKRQSDAAADELLEPWRWVAGTLSLRIVASSRGTETGSAVPT